MLRRHIAGRLIATATLTCVVASCSGPQAYPSPSMEQAYPSPSTEKGSEGSALWVAVKEDQPGTGLQKDNTHNGIDISLASWVANKLKRTPIFTGVTTKDRDQYMEEKWVHMMVATYSIVPDRELVADFVGPYLKTELGFLVRTGDKSNMEYKNLRKRHICTGEKSTSASPSDLPNHYTEVDYSNCVEDLKNPKSGTDGVYADLAILYGYAQASGGKLRVVEGSGGNVNRWGIALPKGQHDQCLRIKEWLKEYIRNQLKTDMRISLHIITENDPNWEARYIPDPKEVDAYSCKDTTKTPS